MTESGLAQSRKRGRLLVGDLSPGEIVHFMHAPTLRTRQTIEEIRSSMAAALSPGDGVDLLDVREQAAIRNPDLYVAGQRVEMVSSAEALAEQLSAPPVDPATVSMHPFFSGFWAAPDRIGYWVEHPDPPGEDPAAVARRQMTFAMSLPGAWEGRPVRYVLSTHSPVLRAILLAYLGEDPGEPGYLEPIDLILPEDGPSTLRFRNLQRTVSDTRVRVLR